MLMGLCYFIFGFLGLNVLSIFDALVDVVGHHFA